MRVGLGIDDSVDVSEALLKRSGMFVLPSTLHLGEERAVVGRDAETTARFYAEQWLDHHAQNAVSSALSVEDVEALVTDRLAPAFDYVFLVTLMSERSQTPRNAQRAARNLSRQTSAKRRQGPFALKVIDSRSVFTGPALLAWEAARLIEARALPDAIRDRLDTLIPQIDAYLVPRDLGYMRSRLLSRGEHSIGWLTYQLARALDVKPILRARRGRTSSPARVRGFDAAVRHLFERAQAQLERGLGLPCIAVSYGGPLDALEKLPGFAELRASAAEYNVEIMTAVMSAAGAANVGTGAVSLSYCTPLRSQA
ncbi:MAG TPA: DegV family protein [Solimonas sp.]